MNNIPTLKELNQIRAKGFRPVVVGCIIFEKKLLFFYSQKNDIWLLPQGGIENKESVKKAFAREMAEELGDNFNNFWEKDFEIFGDDQLEFPNSTQGSRDLKTDDGKEVFMKGKKYFFVKCSAKENEIDITKTEFQKYCWCDFEQALNLVESIYQKGKQRIMKKIITTLKNKNII